MREIISRVLAYFIIHTSKIIIRFLYNWAKVALIRFFPFKLSYL